MGSFSLGYSMIIDGTLQAPCYVYTTSSSVFLPLVVFLLIILYRGHPDLRRRNLGSFIRKRWARWMSLKVAYDY